MPDRRRYSRGASARILERLRMAHGRIVPHDALMLAAWGNDEPPSADETLKVLIHKLRRKLGSDSIGTVHGVGYLMPAEVAARLPEIDGRILVPAERADA